MSNRMIINHDKSNGDVHIIVSDTGRVNKVENVSPRVSIEYDYNDNVIGIKINHIEKIEV